MNRTNITFSYNSSSHTFLYALLGLLLLTSCLSNELKISEFKFQYNNKDYLVRSAYCAGNPESCNQLIGDEFLAVDMNQDRIIDKIMKGNVTLNEAQEIYDHCLNILEKEDKLNEVNRNNKRFTIRENDFEYEVKTFYPTGGDLFNEFTITDKRSGITFNDASVLIDNDADGVLDVSLTGKILLVEAQTHYNRVLIKGLSNKKLIKEGNLIYLK